MSGHEKKFASQVGFSGDKMSSWKDFLMSLADVLGIDSKNHKPIINKIKKEGLALTDDLVLTNAPRTTSIFKPHELDLKSPTVGLKGEEFVAKMNEFLKEKLSDRFKAELCEDSGVIEIKRNQPS